jgi:ribosomal protein S18 acetylase RimI-like enzyme
MTIGSLENIPIETVYNSFIEAFSDYQVDLGLTLDKFKEMVKTRDLNLFYSIGYFDENKLVSFIICGYRELDGTRICYDGGTGTIAAYRRKGMGNQLLRELLKLLGQKGVDHFVLEVLENNKAAIDLYKKNGFEITRKLNCYETDKEKLKPCKNGIFTISENASSYPGLDLEIYLTFTPSWQNTRKSVLNVIDRYAYAAVKIEGETVAFGLVHKTKGDIPQIGVLPAWRNKGLEGHILNNLKERTLSEKLIFLNVEEGDYLVEELLKLGFHNHINQYEMMLSLLDH